MECGQCLVAPQMTTVKLTRDNINQLEIDIMSAHLLTDLLIKISLGQIGSCQGTTKVYATFIEKT